MRKKKLAFHSSFSRLKTGFSNSSRELLRYLYSTGKYDIVEMANGVLAGSPAENDCPWKVRGTLPHNYQELHKTINDPNILRSIQYGSASIDQIIQEEKPDVYICAEDAWATAWYDRKWWDKIPCVQWITIDSSPLFKQLKENLPRCKNIWTWSDFATKEIKKHGGENVDTVRPMFDYSKFFPLSKENKLDLKNKVGLGDTLVFGFVFRNQLRKLVGALIEGFAQFKEKNPNVKTKLLLHTNYAEGWDIESFRNEFNLKSEDILCTYICKNCKNLSVAPFHGNNLKCETCGVNEAKSNPTIVDGVTTEQLNLIYNLMDAYVHPATSGGYEMPMAEAMLCGLPCATAEYSFGKDFVASKLVYSLNYSTYREQGSNFIKASPHPYSIATFMNKVHKNKEEYYAIGQKSRAWLNKEFDNRKSAKFVEDFIDAALYTDYNFDFSSPKGNPNYPIVNIPDNTEWLLDLYKNVLNMNEVADSKGVQDWLESLKRGTSRQDIHAFFINEAHKQNAAQEKVDIKDLVKKNLKETNTPKLVYVMPESLGDCVISLNVLKGLKETYPDYEIYTCTKPGFSVVFEPFVGDLIDGVIPYVNEIMDHFMFWEGNQDHKGLVDMVFLPHVNTQRIPNYIRGGKDRNGLI